MEQFNSSIYCAKNQQLTYEIRLNIEFSMNSGIPISKITKQYENKDVETIRKEIKNNSITYCTSPKCTQCINYDNCSQKNACEVYKAYGNSCKECLRSDKCELCLSCDHKAFKKTCLLHKYCNYCSKIKRCSNVKIIYNAESAQKSRDYKKSLSIKKLKGFKDSDFINYVDNRILNDGIMPDALLGQLNLNNPFSLTVTPKTLYSYIDKSLLKTRNIDLRQKVKRKSNLPKKIEKDITKQYKLNRTIHDRPKEVEDRKIPRSLRNRYCYWRSRF